MQKFQEEFVEMKVQKRRQDSVKNKNKDKIRGRSFQEEKYTIF